MNSKEELPEALPVKGIDEPRDNTPAENETPLPEKKETAYGMPENNTPAQSAKRENPESTCGKVLFSICGRDITVNNVFTCILISALVFVCFFVLITATSKKKMNSTTIAPTTTETPTTRLTPQPRPTGYKIVSPNPYPYYFFPVIANEPLIFKEAVEACSYYDGYHLAGLDATNPDFLHNTTDLIRSVNAPAVWMGGYFNLSVKSPANLVFWTDGQVTDAAKAPAGLWCTDVASELRQLRASMSTVRPAGGAIVPIIRKQGSECLSLHSSDLYLQDEYKRTYPAMCTKIKASAFTKNADGQTVVSEFYKFPAFFDYTDGLAINDVRNKILCQYDSVCSVSRYGGEMQARTRIAVKTRRQITLLPHVANHVFVGFPQLVNYNTAAAICSLVRFANVSNPGQIISYQYLNMTTEKKLLSSISDIDIIKESFDDSISRLILLDNDGAANLRLANDSDNAFLTTAAHFQFTPGASPSSYKELVWKLDSELVDKKSDLNVTYGWCDGENMQSNLEKLYSEFNNWYNNQGGNLTTGPYRVHVAIRRIPSCFELVSDDLYWPGTKSFIPVCQAPKPL